MMVYEAELHRWVREHPSGSNPTESPAAAGDSLADRVRRWRRRRIVSVHPTKFGT